MSPGFFTKLLHRRAEVAPSQPDETEVQLTYESAYCQQVPEGGTPALRCFFCDNEVKRSTARFCLLHRDRYGGRIFCNDCLHGATQRLS